MEINKVNQREQFVLQALEPGANLSALCRDFGVTRTTGYKWIQRFRERGLEGLRELSRGPTPSKKPLCCSADVAVAILRVRRDYPNYGPRKLKTLLEREFPASDVPSSRTICRVLERGGLTRARKVRRRKGTGPSSAPRPHCEAPNDVWSVDFKGWWRTGDGKRAEPLTVQDRYSRYLLAIEVMETPKYDETRAVFEHLFDRFGKPRAIQSDGGSPFAATSGAVGLSRLSAWWLALGIEWHRSRPGCPQDNGGHERMHRDIAQELERRPAWDRAQQQDHCVRWRHTFNHHRPHQALANQVPADVYRRSRRLYTGDPPELVYPEGMVRRKISKCGTGRYMGAQRYVSLALGGYHVGFEPFGEASFRVWFAGRCVAEGDLPWVSTLRPPSDPTP